MAKKHKKKIGSSIGVREEYNTLRSEILNKIKSQNDIIKYTFISMFSLLSINFQFELEWLYIIIYLLIIVNSMIYFYNKNMSVKLSTYIQVFIESKSSELNWETRAHCSSIPKEIDEKFKNFIGAIVSFIILCFLCIKNIHIGYCNMHICCYLSNKSIIIACFIMTIVILIIDIFFQRNTYSKWIQIWKKVKNEENTNSI